MKKALREHKVYKVDNRNPLLTPLKLLVEN